MATLAASAAHRRSILSLYRRCLRSVERIPSPDQRSVYLVYVRDGFRGGSDCPIGSKRAEDGIRDAEEQVERMEYYHSIREEKEREKKASSGVGVGAGAGILGRAPPMTASTTPAMTEGATTNVDRTGHGDPGGAADDDDAEEEEKEEAVRRWLSSAVPHLRDDDVRSYASALVDDGFDSVGMIESELAPENDGEEGDLAFMKKAHRRAVSRALRRIREGNGAGD